MRRALRSGPRREVLGATAWALVFALLLVLRVALQWSEPSSEHALRWLRLGAVSLLVLLVVAAALARRAPLVGSIVLRVEQAAAFVAITRLLGLGAQPDPGRSEQLLIALLGVHAVGAIVVSDDVSAGSQTWRTALWALAISFGVLTATLFPR
jgi:succinate dehydrogenase hydrophobic anchor subunit